MEEAGGERLNRAMVEGCRRMLSRMWNFRNSWKVPFSSHGSAARHKMREMRRLLPHSRVVAALSIVHIFTLQQQVRSLVLHPPRIPPSKPLSTSRLSGDDGDGSLITTRQHTSSSVDSAAMSSKPQSTSTSDNTDGNALQYFLLKSEPSDYSISDLQNDQTDEWNGIRNYQARNYLRSMKVNDRAFFYHSKASKPSLTGIVGTVRIARTAQPDMTAFDTKSEYYDAKCTKEDCKWSSVLVEYEQTFPVVLSLKELKDIAAKEPEGIIAGMGLLKQSRLSVVPLTFEEWGEVMRLIEAKIDDD